MPSTKELIKQFENMSAMPLIEISDFNAEHYLFDIMVNRNYIKASCSTHDIKDTNVRWDTCFSLDEHLQTLVEGVYEKIGYHSNRNYV